jgi:hypothetical protein
MEGGLAIVAPRLVLVGQEMSLGVFLRQNQEPVAGVSVWGITKEAAETLKNEISIIKEKGANLTESDYESVLSGRAFRIGKTGDNGKLSYTFQETGNFIMIAFKAHYWPDIAGIVVGEKPVTLPALAVKAPRSSPPGESVTVSVYEKGTEEPVKDAAVWALTKEQAETLQTRLDSARKASQLLSTDWEVELKALSAIFLGTTNGSGDLKYTFEETGTYLLVALKPGFLPGRAGIVIKNPLQALTIQAPRKATVNEPVTITVSQRGTGDAVKDASIWAIGRDKAAALKEETAKIKMAGDPQNADWESVISLYGTKLGETNGDGKLKTSFDNAGGYLLIAVKKGYIPGYTGIVIVAPQDIEKPDSSSAK